MRKLLVCSLLFLLAACHAPGQSGSASASKPSMPTTFDKQGHRGCRGLFPENTIPAMLHALQLGVTTLEMDVCVSKDSQLVLSHEAFFNHEISTQPNGKGITEQEEKAFNLYKMNYAEIRQFDVGQRPHPRFPQQQKMKAEKPLLSALFDSVKQYMTQSRRAFPYFNIEIKSLPETDDLFHPKPEKFTDLLLRVIQDKEMQSYCIIQSFDVRPLQYLRRTAPDMPIALLVEDTDMRPFDQQLKRLGFTPNIYSPHFSHVTPTLVAACQTKGIKLIPWTVNQKEEIIRLRGMGVDGIISDYPNLFD